MQQVCLCILSGRQSEDIFEKESKVGKSQTLKLHTVWGVIWKHTCVDLKFHCLNKCIIMASCDVIQAAILIARLLANRVLYEDFSQSESLGAPSDVLTELQRRHIVYIDVVFLHCTMRMLKNRFKSSQLWQIISRWILAKNLPNFGQSCLKSPKT